MKKILFYLVSLLLLTTNSYAQKTKNNDSQGHYNINKFKQLKQELPTPNEYRTASGAPGPKYYQQQADYKMNIILDDKNRKLSGKETITYHNNSPQNLSYLWLQLDQNIRTSNSKTPDIQSDKIGKGYKPEQFVRNFMNKPFKGGFHIEYVKDINNSPLSYTINRTMMRVDLPTPLKSGEATSLKIKWWYNINNHVTNRARSGYEHFKKDGNNEYIIAQFYPRMAVYDDKEGWQNSQFWGRGEFALEFGNFNVNITTPADHILDGTGILLNRKDMLTKKQWKRYEEAKQSFDKPVVIVTQKEAEEKEKHFSTKTKTWKFHANNVRDFAFASSRKFIFDAQAVKIGDKVVMAESLYPKEGNPLWGNYSTKVVAHTLKSYSKHLFNYPYPKAISVHAKNQGMEYPMICWNGGRPNPDGTYSKRTFNRMVGVITHEVGHNWFPMIVNSDERQWTWMDEGLNSFTELLAEQEFIPGFPSRGFPSGITSYMAGDQSKMTPIMTQSNNIYHFGSNAYSKPTAALYILREVILGHKLFDYAFKTYANRWKFKHPSPADFFRTMEDASATDLDWFWRGWFYTTANNDIGIKNIKRLKVTTHISKSGEKLKKYYHSRGINMPSMVYFVEDSTKTKISSPSKKIELLSNYVDKTYSKATQNKLANTKYFYEIEFEKPGGLVMPIIAEYVFADGSKQTKYYPAQIWRFNDKNVTKIIASDKELKEVHIDPNMLTADVNLNNNNWPKKKQLSKFEKFKKKLQN